jgi:hypothetical protein
MFVLWISDLDSPSYFVLSAAVDLGFFARTDRLRRVGGTPIQ